MKGEGQKDLVPLRVRQGEKANMKEKEGKNGRQERDWPGF